MNQPDSFNVAGLSGHSRGQRVETGQLGLHAPGLLTTPLGPRRIRREHQDKKREGRREAGVHRSP